MKDYVLSTKTISAISHVLKEDPTLLYGSAKMDNAIKHVSAPSAPRLHLRQNMTGWLSRRQLSLLPLSESKPSV
jgi:hypothetical protein